VRARGARSATLLALWVVAAVGALLVGLTAVGSIGSGLAGAGLRQPLSAAEIDARLSATAPSVAAPASPAPTATPAPAVPPASGQAVVVSAQEGGTLVARCAAGVPVVVSVSPAQGFAMRNEQHDGGPRVEFESAETRIRVRLSCVDGRPTGVVDRHG
jgi:hypothetical protein